MVKQLAAQQNRGAALKVGRCTSQRPLVKRDLWPYLPPWIALYAERGSLPKCWEGHRLQRESCRRSHPLCTYCEASVKCRSTVLVCRKCPWWLICSQCAARPRLPPLRLDPLFFGPHTPRLLPPSALKAVSDDSRGSLIICPGGNYQFLVPHEGMPVAEYFAEQGFRTFVLRYRLLPKYDFEEIQQDLVSAAALLRGLKGGPICAMGFSAGGHLVASTVCHGKGANLDAQALIYPCIDGSDWASEESCGFWGDDFEKCFRKGQSLLSTRKALLGGPGFWAPPTFMVSSTKDAASPPKEHTDIYAAALRKRRVKHCTYLRKNFGPHGFGMSGGWTKACVNWLHQRGFGVPP